MIITTKQKMKIGGVFMRLPSVATEFKRKHHSNNYIHLGNLEILGLEPVGPDLPITSPGALIY